jgi:hypothetical protein
VENDSSAERKEEHHHENGAGSNNPRGNKDAITSFLAAHRIEITVGKFLFRVDGRPIGERDGAAATNHREEHMVEALMFLRGIVEFELRAEP